MNPLTAKVRAIIRREYLQRVRSKWFLLSTLGLPLLFIGLYYALSTGYRFARDRFGGGPSAVRACAPVAILSTAISCGFLWLFVG